MGIRAELRHRTAYRYDRPVQLGPQVVRLRPAPHCRTPIVHWAMDVEPGPVGTAHFCNWVQDPQANFMARLVFPKPVQRLVVDVTLVADLSPINPFDFFLEESARETPFTYDQRLAHELEPYLELTDEGPLFDRLLSRVDRTKRPTIDFLVELNQLVNAELDYTIRMEPGVQTCEDTLDKGIGSCRDFAWLAVQLLRRCGLAARFVSGYSIQLVADVKPVDPNAPAGVAKDVCDLHAWAEAYLPGAGWVGLDATSGLLCGEGHIPLAAAPDPTSAAPIAGAFTVVGDHGRLDDSAETDVAFDVNMAVARLHEDPRVTKPYADAAWQAIDALGRRIDDDLTKHDVRLTMGGEPTFVSASDPEADEWHTAALGPTKQKLATDLLHRLHDAWAPGGMTHEGQGKWYPGEELPRWALSVYARRDGQPIWHNRELIDHRPPAAKPDTPAGMDAVAQAEAFVAKLAHALGLPERYAIPCFEDDDYYEHVISRLPVNVTPTDNKLPNPLERRRLKRVVAHGLTNPVGYALPLQRVWHTDPPAWHTDPPAWHTGPWHLRTEKLYLVPGDSPLGLRLPAPSFAWADEEDFPFTHEADPSDPDKEPLPDADALAALAAQPPKTDAAHPADDARVPEVGESAKSIPRTAVCVEPRMGRLHVFLPPQRTAADYLALVAAIEHAAAALDQPVVLEGYTPPTDPRLHHFKLTPDPGVIEVNLPPVASWPQLTEQTDQLYHHARHAGLSTEKFQVDGRHTGTGGGNHIVVGAPDPLDSPFLRRPDLLASLLTYWNNHPSLSYLFSSLFIGPTSQAPRVDEGRPDALHELELALQHTPYPNDPHIRGEYCVPAWFTDRAFRHLLTDLTGNTHRAEFCIDKLYSPDSSTGRLGLVEFRGFEMPPHPRMALAQNLLLRALIAMHWQQPRRTRLTRWGTALHDRCLLPHFVEQDFHEVLAELTRFGYPFAPDWYASHLEFRFPVVGGVQHQETQLTLRTAIEPWITLGEESTGSGTSRYVDSSCERVEVKLTHLNAHRYTLAVNRVAVPLTPTGVAGEYVAGVKYRAWQPWSALHPRIPVDAPLVFELLDTCADDTGQGTPVAGCTYHVAHPGGRSHDDFPVNALAAETRRKARFDPYPRRTGKPAPLITAPRSAEYPVTLDLRSVRT
ncbi:MAG: transglutaminase family protein [Planctomycetota bacterium]